MLQETDIKFYRANGYLLVKGVLSKAEAARYREESHCLIARLGATANLDATWGSAKGISGKQTVIQHCHNVQFYCAAFTAMMTGERFTKAASQLIGSENVQLHHNKMFIKPPEKGSPFPMHQDYPYFPHERHTMMAAIFHFDDAPLEKGCVRVVPGSHLQGPLDHSPEGGWHLPLDKYPLEDAVACPAEAGDVLFFNYLTIHGSGVNVSNEARTTLLIQMRDPEDKPTVKTHESRGQGMMLRGIDPGAAYTGL